MVRHTFMLRAAVPGSVPEVDILLQGEHYLVLKQVRSLWLASSVVSRFSLALSQRCSVPPTDAVSMVR